jgi:hypothetical protein
VKQLRAYLFVFEQMLANDFAQLAHTPRLLSISEDAPAYVWQPLYELEGAQAILKGAPVPTPGAEAEVARRDWAGYQADSANPYAAGLAAIASGWSSAFGRREDVLDHLLARFAEAMPRLDWRNFETGAQKAKFLRHYPELSARRHLALDFPEAQRQRRTVTRNVSALEHKVNLLLAAGSRGPLEPLVRKEGDAASAAGFEPYPKRAYFLLEHQLFVSDPSGVPYRGDGEAGNTESDPPLMGIWKDFFSRRLSHVLANWSWYELRHGFQAYVEQLVLDSAPAHLSNRFHWLERGEDMDAFAALVERWYASGLSPLEVVEQDADALWVRATGPAYELVRWLVLQDTRDGSP